MWPLPRMTTDNILKYLRKSRTDDPGLSVEEVLQRHEQMLDDWVARTFPGQPPIPERNCFREVVSGETISDRPQVQAMLRKIEAPIYKAILIKEPQRLSRGDLEDIGHLVKLLRYTNTIVITLDYIYDLSNEHDRRNFEQELKRGNDFLEYQKRIMGAGRALSLQNGNFIGNTAPYGYRKIVIKEGKRKAHTLEPDPETAPIVEMIFRMYADGTSANQIARNLNASGIPTAKGGKWTVSGVKHLLGNDHYLGLVHWNARKTRIVVEDGEIITTRPRTRDEYITYPGKHPAIIDQELWDKVQSIRHHNLPVKERCRHANPFAGFVRCQCGATMSRRKYERNGIERSAPRLLCDNQLTCGTASCTMEEFTAAVIEAMESQISDFDLKIANSQEDSSILQAQRIAALEKRLDELDRQELSMWDKYTQEDMPRHIFDRLHKKLLTDRTAAETELEELRSTVPVAIDYQQKKATFTAALFSLQDPNASVKQQNLLLRQCIKSITYNRQHKDGPNRRFGTPKPLELDFTFNF